MCQIRVLTVKLCTFLVQNGSFLAFWHHKNKERLSRGLEVKWHIPSTCPDASEKWFSIGIYGINWDSVWPCLETHEGPQAGQMCTERRLAALYLFHTPTGIGGAFAEGGVGSQNFHEVWAKMASESAINLKGG